MSWKRLTYDDMRMYLAKDELEKLQSYSVDQDFTTVVNDTLDVVADAFRGAWTAKGYQIDSRDHYISTSYQAFIMAYARWTLWSRFPMADNYALSEPRKMQYEEAVALLKNPYIGVDPVAPDEDPEDPDAYLSADAAISVPALRFPPTFEEGFPEAYWLKRGGNCL